MRRALTTFTTTMALSLTLTISGLALAGPNGDTPTRPEMRQEVQQQYIFTALWEGRLAWPDAKALLAEQDAVLVRMERFRGDGSLTSREVKVLDYMLDISSRNIDVFLRGPSPVPSPDRPAHEQRDELVAAR